MNDIDHCGCLAEIEIDEKDVGIHETTEVFHCTDCGETWVWIRPPTIAEALGLLKQQCREAIP